MANDFKAKEEKGKGLNYEHPSPVIRKMLLDDRLEFRINGDKKVKFKQNAKSEGGMAKVLQKFIDGYNKKKNNNLK